MSGTDSTNSRVLATVSVQGGREYNEDFCDTRTLGEWQLLVCADGLGGHDNGDLASRFFTGGLLQFVDPVIEALAGGDEPAIKTAVNSWFALAAEYMRAQIKAAGGAEDAKTTAAVALVGPAVLVAHIGDSRVYRLGRGKPWRTRDHSVVQMLVDQGEVKEADMGTHKDQGKLFKAIGFDGSTDPSVSLQAPLQPQEGLLLCSDGFWEYVSDREMQGLLQGDIEQQLPRWADTACERAGPRGDNVTAVVLGPAAAGGIMGKVLSWLR